MESLTRTVAIAICGLGLLSVVVVTSKRGLAQENPELRSLADPVRLTAFRRALEENLSYVPGEVLVHFKAGFSAERQTTALRSLQADQTTPTHKWIGETLLVSGLQEQDASHAARVLQLQPEVEYAQPNYLYPLQSVPNEPLYSRQWDMEQINMPRAWDISPSAGKSVKVAVIDSGLTNFQGTATFRLPTSSVSFGLFAIPFTLNPDFDFSRVLPAVEFSMTGPWTLSSGQRIVFDGTGHGTHVAGTIAQWTNNSFGFAGVAFGASILPIKICSGTIDWVMNWGATLRIPRTFANGVCDSAGTLQALRFASDSGANVINMSLGGTEPDTFLRNELLYAVSKGAFVTISAGNAALEGNPIEYPSSYAAGIDGVVAVGATNLRKTRARYSNYRSYVELSAPGGECDSQTDRIWQVAPLASDLTALPPRFDRYDEVGICGTSMASPHVAGAAALLYAQGIKNPAAIEAALERFAVDLGAPGKDNEFGYGLIDVRAALAGLGVTR